MPGGEDVQGRGKAKLSDGRPPQPEGPASLEAEEGRRQMAPPNAARKQRMLIAALVVVIVVAIAGALLV